MRDAGLTKQERHLLTLMRVWMALFLIAGITFAVAPDWTLDYILNLGSGLFGWKSPTPSASTERFWLALAISLMATLTYLAYKVQSNILRHIRYTGAILVAKFASTTAFIVCLLAAEKSFLYLAGAVVDGLVFLTTLSFYRSALKSRPSI